MKNPVHAHLPAVAAAMMGLAVLGAAAPAAAIVPGETTIKGTVTSFDGKYDLHVLDHGGDVHDIALHQGTIINPTGLTLQNGMKVTILGNPQGASIAANEIDTPYHIEQTYVQPGYASPYYGGGYNPYGFGAFNNYGYGAFGYPYGGYGYGGYGTPVIINQTVEPRSGEPENRRAPESRIAPPSGRR